MKTMTIICGIPGAGKTRMRTRAFSDLPFVDLNECAKKIEGYDVNHSELFYERAKELCGKEVIDRINSGVDFVYETTGVDCAEVAYLIKCAHRKGYEVEMIHVRCDLSVAKRRNRERDRKVPEDVLVYKSYLSCFAIKMLKPFVDGFAWVDTSKGKLEL